MVRLCSAATKCNSVRISRAILDYCSNCATQHELFQNHKVQKSLPTAPSARWFHGSGTLGKTCSTTSTCNEIAACELSTDQEGSVLEMRRAMRFCTSALVPRKGSLGPLGKTCLTILICNDVSL